MKAKAIILSLLTACTGVTVLAVVMSPFSSWEDLTTHSPDIVLVASTKTPELVQVNEQGIVIDRRDGVVHSPIEVYMSLKGGTNTGPSELVSRYWPRQGEHYLIFARYDYGRYQAIEPYRIVPLGMSFPTNMIAGQPLEDQVRTILKWRLNRLNREIAEEQDEVKRLESGLKSR